MKSGAKTGQAGRRLNSGGSLRLRLTLLVLLTVVSAAGVGIVVDYLRERRLHMEGLFASLEEQALALKLARRRMGNADEFSRYADDFCRQMDGHTSPGHIILVLDPRNKVILGTLHHTRIAVRQVLVDIDKPREILTLGDHRLAQVRVKDDDGSAIVVAQYLDRVEDILAAQLLRRALTASIIVVALVVLLFFVMDTWVIKPIVRLSKDENGK